MPLFNVCFSLNDKSQLRSKQTSDFWNWRWDVGSWSKGLNLTAEYFLLSALKQDVLKTTLTGCKMRVIMKKINN